MWQHLKNIWKKAKLYIGSETDNKENYIRVLKIISDI